MTTEEIEKAAQVESDELVIYCSKYDFKRGFIKGFELSDKHWQEKTRWRSLEKEPPKFEGQKYQVLVRFVPGIYDVVCIIGLRSIERAIAAGYKDWKEIE